LTNVQAFTNNSLKWPETCQETIKAPEINTLYNLTITGFGCNNQNQSTAPIQVKTDTFSNGVISLADTNKINSTLGKFFKYTKYIFIASIMTLRFQSKIIFCFTYVKFGF
jgi:hypothetical protein